VKPAGTSSRSEVPATDLFLCHVPVIPCCHSQGLQLIQYLTGANIHRILNFEVGRSRRVYEGGTALSTILKKL